MPANIRRQSRLRWIIVRCRREITAVEQARVNQWAAGRRRHRRLDLAVNKIVLLFDRPTGGERLVENKIRAGELRVAVESSVSPV